MKALRWVGIVAIGIALAGGLLWWGIHASPAPRLEIDTSVVTPLPAATTPPAESLPGSATVAPSATPVCGESGSLMVLIVGEGRPGEPWIGSSAIRLVKVNFDAGTVKILAIPPDTRVTVPSMLTRLISSSATITEATFDHIYFEAKQATPGDEREKVIQGTRILAQSLAENWGLVPDAYLSVNQPAFGEMVDRLGGLPIDLPRAVDGGNNGYFPAGPQVLSGRQVLDYVEIYEVQGEAAVREWGRFEHQNQVLNAFYKLLTDPRMVSQLPGLLEEFHDDVVTDLSINRLLNMACVMKHPGTAIQQLEIGPEPVTQGPGRILIPHTSEIQEFLATEFLP